MDDVIFSKISEQDNITLIEMFSREEIKKTVWDCEGNKSPGPDGYNFTFMKSCWNVVGEEFCDMVADFHCNDRIVRGGNASFLVLIPKKENPVGLNDYRPIYLIGCMYKVMAKLLADRLSKVMESII